VGRGGGCNNRRVHGRHIDTSNQQIRKHTSAQSACFSATIGPGIADDVAAAVVAEASSKSRVVGGAHCKTSEGYATRPERVHGRSIDVIRYTRLLVCEKLRDWLFRREEVVFGRVVLKVLFVCVVRI